MPRGPTCSDMQLSFIILAFEEGDLYVSVAVLERKTSQGGEAGQQEVAALTSVPAR
jgi:hypothetical protein